MSPEAQRIAIAEFCYGAGQPVHKFVDEDGCEVVGMPDYLSDLNAMHEAEKSLRPTQAARYVSELWSAMCNSEQAELGTIHATAAQHAEAFLRTIGKWKDEEVAA